MAIVMKFGGTSVGDGRSFSAAAAIVGSAAKKDRVCVVVSAMAGVTDALLGAAGAAGGMKDEDIVAFTRELQEKHLRAARICCKKRLPEVQDAIEERIKELQKDMAKVRDTGLTEHFRDRIAAFGEKMSAAILSGAISEHVPSEWHHGDRGLIIVDENFIGPEPDMEATEKEVKRKVLPQMKKGIVPVVTGFMGCTHDGHTVTLGRGSSDHIASIIGACLGASEIQIWTDVDGFLSADPKIVKGSMLIPKLSFAEASELAYFGAKVLHPKTLMPAIQKGIPVRILNTHNPGSAGTLITKETGSLPEVVKSITSKKGVVLVNLVSARMLAAPGFLSKTFETFSRRGISIDMVSTTEVSITLTIDGRMNGRLDPVIKELAKMAEVKVEGGKSIVCVVGEGMKLAAGTAGRVFHCLGEKGINVECISQGASKINISFIVEDKDADAAVRALHNEFFGVHGGRAA
ncbi:MAG: aspartate kinase [Candidatus Aenigmatarchaeota archaeon]